MYMQQSVFLEAWMKPLPRYSSGSVCRWRYINRQRSRWEREGKGEGEVQCFVWQTCWLAGLPHADKTAWLVSHSYCHQLLAMVTSKLCASDIFRQGGNASQAALRPRNTQTFQWMRLKWQNILGKGTHRMQPTTYWVFWKQRGGWSNN